MTLRLKLIFYIVLVSLMLTPSVQARNLFCVELFKNLSKHELAVRGAIEAGLTYQTRIENGITRTVVISTDKEVKDIINYFDSSGQQIHDAGVIARLDALAIPRVWQNVIISADPLAHLQAVGRDSRNKLQPKYHKVWKEVTAALKFERASKFGEMISSFRAINESNLKQAGFSKDKILAAITKLLEVVLIRIGNTKGVEDNDSFGLTTMLKDHLLKDHTRPTLYFKGKSGKYHSKEIEDPTLAALVIELMRLPGDNLFQYIDDKGEIHKVSSSDVNGYIKRKTGQDFSAKDFRTWMATYYATKKLKEIERPRTEREMKKAFLDAAEAAAKELGNTKEVCLESYIHPAIFEAYRDQQRFENAFPRESSMDERALIETGVLNLIREN